MKIASPTEEHGVVLRAFWMTAKIVYFAHDFADPGVSDAHLKTQLESMPFSGALERRLRRIASIAKRPQELLSLTYRGNDPVAFMTQCVVLTKLGYGLAILHLRG